MNRRRIFVAVVLLTGILLGACTPAKTATPQATIIDPLPTTTAQATAPASLPSPTTIPTMAEVGSVVETVALPVNPDRDGVYAFDSLWLPDDSTGIVTRWDPVSRKVLASIKVGDPVMTPYGDPVAVVATTDSIWVTAVAKHAIERIDPGKNQMVEQIPLGQVKGQDLVTNVMIGDDNAMWVWDYDSQITLRIDLKKKQVAATYQNILPAAVENGSLWAWDAKHSNEASNLLRIDPATDQVIAKIPLDKVNPLPASSKNSLWFGHGQDLLRIDPATNQLIASIDLGNRASWGMMVGDSIWTIEDSPMGPPACHDLSQNSLVKIDPNTNTILGKIGLDCPTNMLLFGNVIWVFTGLAATGSGGNLNAVLIQPGK